MNTGEEYSKIYIYPKYSGNMFEYRNIQIIADNELSVSFTCISGKSEPYTVTFFKQNICGYVVI